MSTTGEGKPGEPQAAKAEASLETTQEPGGLTRRELFQGLGAAALAGGLAGSRVAEAAVTGTPPTLGPGKAALKLVVNGEPRTLMVEPRLTLLDALRRELGLTGAKPACERGACGACTVLVGGQPVCSCLLLAHDAAGREVKTVEGLARGEELSPLQQAFVECDALQCGFCTPGMLMSCTAVLMARPQPTAEEIRHGIAGNLCRCGTYPKVLEATLSVAGRQGGPEGNKGA